MQVILILSAAPPPRSIFVGGATLSIPCGGRDDAINPLGLDG